jgi:hypothetical protein
MSHPEFYQKNIQISRIPVINGKLIAILIFNFKVLYKILSKNFINNPIFIKPYGDTFKSDGFFGILALTRYPKHEEGAGFPWKTGVPENRTGKFASRPKTPENKKAPRPGSCDPGAAPERKPEAGSGQKVYGFAQLNLPEVTRIV